MHLKFCLLVGLLFGILLTATQAVRSNASIENDVLHFSYELQHWLDTSKHPCQNFFAYVCGKSLNSSQALLEQRQEQEQQRFEKLISAEQNEQLLNVEQKMKNFFSACKAARSLEDLKGSFMYRNSGGWPAIDDGLASKRRRRNSTWMSVLSAFHASGLEYIFEQRVNIVSNKRVVHIEPAENSRYTLRKFEQLAEVVLKEYAVDAGLARLVALEILSFERSRRDIIKSVSAVNASRELSYAQLKTTLFSDIKDLDWDAYFKNILGKPLRAADIIIVHQLPKLQQLFELVQNTTMTRFLNWLWIDYLMDKRSSDCQELIKIYFEPVYQHIVQRSILDKVQMAHMYAALGRALDETQASTHWIDEISKANSRQFLGRIIHQTLNGNDKLNDDYATLTVTKRNFYRNLEKAQRFLAEQRKVQSIIAHNSGDEMGVQYAANEFMKIFLTLSTLLQQQNLTTPLNYALAGEHFAQFMIASGSSSSTPGAWRSIDSEQDFTNFKQCITPQQQSSPTLNYNYNNLLLKMLAQQQTLHALDEWQQREVTLVRRLDSLLAAGRLQFTLRKLYFIGAVLADCRHYAAEAQKDFVHSYLRNSQEFIQAFGCRAGDELYVRNVCKVMKS